MNREKISVVIPCYNYGQFIEETVDSVLASTFQDLEILVVDDGSDDDNTEKFLRETIAKKQKTRVLRRENGGLPSARNFGAQHTVAPYILFLDADDKVHPDYIRRCFEILEGQSQVAYVYCLVQLFGNENKVWWTLPYQFFYLKFKNFVPATLFIRRSAWEKVGGYRDNMRLGYEDWEFVIRMGKQGLVGYRIKEVLFYYRKHTGSMLAGLKKKHTALFREIRSLHPEIYKAFPIQFTLFLVLFIIYKILGKIGIKL